MIVPDIVRRDPYLNPYIRRINERTERFKAASDRLKRTPGYSRAHCFYGEHFSGGETTIRDWLPNADAVYLLCDNTGWRRSEDYSFKRLNDYGDWEITLKESQLGHDDYYRMLVMWTGGSGERMPAYARRVCQDSSTYIFAARLWNPEKKYEWRYVAPDDDEDLPPVIYEAHIGMAVEEGRTGTYDEFRTDVLPRIAGTGYNTLQLMAVMEHPYYASFGYQVSNFFAASSRYGNPYQFKNLVDEAHGLGLKVIIDLVHSHAVKNEIEGISLQDGTEYLYFHEGGKGTHPAWDSRCFNYAKDETVNFLLSNCRFWLEEYKLDGFRFDGVTSMLYLDHGLGANFDHYDKYFDDNVDEDALLYLTLANDLIHDIKPDAITIAEDMSGLPGIAAPVKDGGCGFDYRLTMGIPDYWIRIIKEKKDEDWQVSEILNVLLNRRSGEEHIAYSESHDQALVGDKTLLFRLMDSAMYTDMVIGQASIAADRGISLIKIINLLTFALGGDGYLTFMGNEFGHPEWIDFPREGNGWSYDYARRQWHLADDRKLRYSSLLAFTSDMIKNCIDALKVPETIVRHVHDADGIVSFQRGRLQFVFSLNGKQSFPDYGIESEKGRWKLVLDSDSPIYDGHGRLAEGMEVKASTQGDGTVRMNLYIPTRTAMVFRKTD